MSHLQYPLHTRQNLKQGLSYVPDHHIWRLPSKEILAAEDIAVFT